MGSTRDHQHHHAAPWDLRGITMDSPWDPWHHHTSMEAQWDQRHHHGIFIEETQGSTMEAPWDRHGSTTGLPWDRHDSMEAPRSHYGITMLPLKHRGTTGITLETSPRMYSTKRSPWEHHGTTTTTDPWRHREIATEAPWGHGVPMLQWKPVAPPASPWDHHGILEPPWDHRGIIMISLFGSPWHYHGIIMRSPCFPGSILWRSHDDSIVLPWCSYGALVVSVVFSWCLHGDPMGTHGASNVVS